MKEIKITVAGKLYTFQVRHEEIGYYFLECTEKPEMRGFYTKNFVSKNMVA